MKNQKQYYIAEFAEKVGVYKDTVRNYQKKGLLPDRRNKANNYRIFTDEDIKTMKRLTTVKQIEVKQPEI